MLACLVTLPAFITLVVLFFWTITSGIFGDDQNQNGNNNGEYRPWWDDMRPEEMEALKMVLNLAFLAIACATLFVPITKASSGVYERFNEGVLAASMFMFGNMLLVSFWYQINFGRRDEEQNNQYNGNYNGNGYNNYYYMDEEQRIEYHQKVVSYSCLALGIAFYAAGNCVYGGASMTPEEGTTSSILRTSSHSHVSIQFDLMNEMWRFLSLASIVLFSGLFIAACLLTGGEEADRMIEEGRLVNLILVLLWAVLCTIAMMVWGSTVSTERGSDSLSVGMLYGSTKYFAALLAMVCILTGNFSFDERQREERGNWVATATSFSCFFLSLVYFVFSMRARRYQVAVIDANTQKVTVLSQSGAATGMVSNSSLGGDFVRVDEHGMVVDHV